MANDLYSHEIKTSILKHDTRELTDETLPQSIHDQYLDRLYRQYNIQVNHAILFYVESDPDPVIFVDKPEINVGREDDNGRITPEFDLSIYDGANRGVSRLHARIIWDDSKYLIQDLHSTNYTWLNGKKLVAYQYVELADGDILQFGRLAMNVFIIRR